MTKKNKEIKKKIIDCLNQYADSKTFEEIVETAIPAYIHKNPIVRQIFWRRVFVILKQVEKLSPKSVLDFGCGSGIVMALLNPKINRFVTDIFNEPFDFMQQCLGLQDVKKLYPSDLDKTEFKFEIILAADVLEHLSDNEILRYLSLFHRRLNTDGYLIVSGPTENLIYKIGRKIAGYKGDYHKTNVKIIDATISNSGLFHREGKIRWPIPYILEGFWMLTYKKI